MNMYNRFFQMMNKLASCILLSLLWLAASVPIITVGASSTALYYAVHKVLRGEEGYAWQEFWRGFRMNWKQATVVWLIVLGIVLLQLVDILVFSLLLDSKIWIIFAVSLLLTLAWMQYLFPYIARIQDRTRVVLKNALILCGMYVILSIVLLAAFLAMIILPFAFPYLIPFAVLLFPALFSLLSEVIMERIFSAYQNGSQQESDVQTKEQESRP